MRRMLLFLVFAGLSSTNLLAQVTSPRGQNTTTSPVATQDPQAMSVLNQALGVAGGAAAISAITDYTGAGQITYHLGHDQTVQGNVTLQILGVERFRLDASLPSGVRSWLINEGRMARKSENGTTFEFPPKGTIPSSDAFPYQSPMFPGGLVFPHLPLTGVSADTQYGVSYKGVVPIDGHSAHEIEVQFIPTEQPDPENMIAYHTTDFFIDTSSLQLLMTQDTVPKNVVHQLQYSDYRLVNNALFPFAISEVLGGQKSWTIQLDQVRVNLGLQESVFDQ